MSLSVVALLGLMAAAPKIDFDAQKAKAQVLDRPEKALAAIIGGCHQDDVELQIQCQDNVKAARKQYLGQTYLVDLGAGHQDLLQFEGVHGNKGRFLWVPMYDPGNGQPMTTTAPKRLTKEGWPILKKRVIDGPMPSGMIAADLRRAAMLGQVNIELIGRFTKIWKLKGRGKVRGKLVQGVVFKATAIRFSQARTGTVIFDAALSTR